METLARCEIKPDNYDAAFREHYGMHAAPYPNHNLPMGMREGKRLLAKGVSMDCLLCHGGAIFGESIIGLATAHSKSRHSSKT